MVTKKQHYVPRSYLRHFASNYDDLLNDKKLRINVFDKKLDKVFVNNIYNIACENYFYDLNNNHKQYIENYFAENIEKQFSMYNRKIEKKCLNIFNLYESSIINQQEKIDISILLIMQLLRTKRMRIHINRMYDRAYKKISPFIKRYNDIFIDKKNLDFRIEESEKKLHCECLFDSEYVSELSFFIYDSIWMFTHNFTELPFITSDNPVSRIPRIVEGKFHLNYIQGNKKRVRNDIISGFLTDYLEINYPISPRVSLTIFRRKVPGFDKLKKYDNSLVPIFDEEKIMQNNIMQFIMSNRQVYISEKQDKIVDRLKKMDIKKFKGPLI